MLSGMFSVLLNFKFYFSLDIKFFWMKTIYHRRSQADAINLQSENNLSDLIGEPQVKLGVRFNDEFE